MNVNRISLLMLFAGISLFSCKDKTGEQVAAEDSTRFSGKKFNEHIRSTEARTPDEEQSGFKLPPGFEIELYASEPDIGKPINITFDAKGRMWVTQSFEYPFPASPGKGTDRISILEDTNKDGKADRFTQFSDTLNIPIGILPLNDGAIAYSIPNVYRFTDNNADGKADAKKILFGPFEHRDTHGMVNNFMRGYDGWVDACHGFTNRSTVAGTDGDSIHMISGNTFRFRLDGSRVEHFTHGRINPFGLAYDERGYLYSTDCHTSPLYQLIRGADYTQWGKEEAMGFAPDMKPLEREATALAGIAYYADVKYPEAYQRNFYIGDAVASRVYRNSFSFKGSSPVGKLEEEFVLSEDPWFRPVDVKLGPDGALYIADFYNSIIGHYEVPLNHPKRDKVRGRIWRITYKGQENEVQDLSSTSLNDLLLALDSDNLIVRMAAADQVVDRIGKAAVAATTDLINKKNVSARAYIHGLWILHRLNGLTDAMIIKALANSDPVIRLHSLRILDERDQLDNSFFEVVSKSLLDNDPHVKRAATELLVNFPTMASLKLVLAERGNVPDDDTHQLYTTRLVLRNLLRNDGLMKEAMVQQWKQQETDYVVDVLLGVPSSHAAMFLASHLNGSPEKGERLTRLYEHLARYIPAEQLDGVIASARTTTKNKVDDEYITFKGIQQGIARRGAKESTKLQQWGTALAKALFEKYHPDFNSKTPEDVAKQKFAADLAGKYKIQTLEPTLLAFVKQGSQADPEVKIAALRSLLIFDTDKHALLAGKMLKDTVAPQLKNRIASLLGDFSGPGVNKVLGDVTDAPPDLQAAVVMALARTSEGKNIIFRKVRKGELLPRTLIDPKVEERLLMNISPQHKKEFETITASLEPVSKERQTLIDTRLIAFSTITESLSPDSGRIVFTKNCSPCHAIQSNGGSIGPQLDGVGKWGPKALAEKILDPNRNVSEAFRNYTITLKDGKVMSGLFRREEGEVIVFADISGKEFSVPKNNIAQQKISRYTLMPDHFGEVLSQEDFNALLKYLLSIQS
jgi:putative heme-binding domain-containing protein